MTTLIGRTFTHHGLKGAKQLATVVAEAAAKRGKTLLTIRLADGTEYKMDARSLPAPIVFAEPDTGPMFVGRDRYRYSRDGRIHAV